MYILWKSPKKYKGKIIDIGKCETSDAEVTITNAAKYLTDETLLAKIARYEFRMGWILDLNVWIERHDIKDVFIMLGAFRIEGSIHSVIGKLKLKALEVRIY